MQRPLTERFSLWSEWIIKFLKLDSRRGQKFEYTNNTKRKKRIVKNSLKMTIASNFADKHIVIRGQIAKLF